MKVPDQAAFGLAELQKLTGATNKGRLRAALPPPDANLSMGPVWLRETVVAWLGKAGWLRT
jgi:hypothetical protein